MPLWGDKQPPIVIRAQVEHKARTSWESAALENSLEISRAHYAIVLNLLKANLCATYAKLVRESRWAAAPIDQELLE